jgi:hypothetical protein
MDPSTAIIGLGKALSPGRVAAEGVERRAGPAPKAPAASSGKESFFARRSRRSPGDSLRDNAQRLGSDRMPAHRGGEHRRLAPACGAARATLPRALRPHGRASAGGSPTTRFWLTHQVQSQPGSRHSSAPTTGSFAGRPMGQPNARFTPPLARDALDDLHHFTVSPMTFRIRAASRASSPPWTRWAAIQIERSG